MNRVCGSDRAISVKHSSLVVRPRWWTDLERPEPEQPRWPQPNRPQTNLDWYEAVAFTRWFNARLGLAEGSIRLPTELEWEWEKAARGEQGLTYPWGNDYESGFANVDETETKQGPWYLKQTTAVGVGEHVRSTHGYWRRTRRS